LIPAESEGARSAAEIYYIRKLPSREFGLQIGGDGACLEQVLKKIKSIKARKKQWVTVVDARAGAVSGVVLSDFTEPIIVVNFVLNCFGYSIVR